MEQAAAQGFTIPAGSFRDGLGERRSTRDPNGGERLELLCLRRELAAVPSFEFALRERVSRLAAFRHASYGRVRGVERLADPSGTIAVVSEHTPGVRLSTLLAHAEEQHLLIDINAALYLIRYLVPAMAMLHEHARDAAHGALGPDRLVLTPEARLVIVEHVTGGALEQLRFSPERYWSELRVPLPPNVGSPRFDHRTDTMQIGVVALSLILGRTLREDEYPTRIGELVASTWAVSPRGGFEPPPPGLRAWLGRALQLDPRSAFPSAIEARDELDNVPSHGDQATPPASLRALLAQYHGDPSVISVAPVSGRVPVPLSVTPVAAAAPAPSVVRPEPAQARVEVKAAAAPPAPPLAARLGGLEDRSVPAPNERRRWPLIAAVAASLVALAAVGVWSAQRHSGSPPQATAPTGNLVVTTNPSGVAMYVDGELRGSTPLTLALRAGSHVVELRGAGDPRSIPVMIAAGSQVDQYIELPKSVSAGGQLQVRTDPSGAAVSVDGVSRGTSPVLVSDLSPGEHTVALTSELGTVKQPVTVEAGLTASLMVPLSAPQGAPVSGWVAIAAPVALQLYEKGQLLGTNATDRIMVSVGRHDIELVNEEIGYRASRTIQVAPGRVASLDVEVPKGTMALNALPWAEVWVDGERIGETPIGNLPIRVGKHDVLFRNPDLGEQRQSVVVTLAAPARVSADLRKK